jgi:uncharacterized protein YndB with AHSA1/START domain
MATTERIMDATPEEVFAVLSDPQAYSHWVVGSASVRGADEDFPAVGSRFHHTVGIGPLQLPDHTEVLESHPPRRLVLRARARPLGTARVAIDLHEHRRGTRVVLDEHGADPITRLVLLNPLAGLLVDQRNRISLRRLEELVVRRRDHGPAAGRERQVSRRPRSGSSSRA